MNHISSSADHLLTAFVYIPQLWPYIMIVFHWKADANKNFLYLKPISGSAEVIYVTQLDFSTTIDLVKIRSCSYLQMLYKIVLLKVFWSFLWQTLLIYSDMQGETYWKRTLSKAFCKGVVKYFGTISLQHLRVATFTNPSTFYWG